MTRQQTFALSAAFAAAVTVATPVEDAYAGPAVAVIAMSDAAVVAAPEEPDQPVPADNVKFPKFPGQAKVAAAGVVTSPSVGAAGIVTSPIDTSAPTTGTNEELQQRLSRAQEELARYRAAETAPEKKLAIFGLLAAATWTLLSVFKRLSNMSQKAKRWLPRVTAVAAVATGLLTYLAIGSTLADAVLYGAGPGMAALIQEVLAPWLPKKTKAASGA